MSHLGTFETCRPTLMMSVHRGRRRSAGKCWDIGVQRAEITSGKYLCAPLRRPDFLTFALRFLFRIPILESALSWRRSKATIQFCIGHGLQRVQVTAAGRAAPNIFHCCQPCSARNPILASRLGKESPYNRQLADDPCLILTRSGSELSPPLQDEVDPGVLLRRERGYVRHRQKRSKQP
jgi:hypothetical protein